MVYIFILTLVVINLYTVDKFYYNKSIIAFFVSVSPSFFILWLFPAIQFGVGDDYFAYLDMYSDPKMLERFYMRSEYFFYHIYNIIVDYRLGEQFIFFFSSFFNSRKFTTIIKIILVYALSFMVYSGVGFLFSFLIVWLKSS